MELVPGSVRKLWNDWELRVMVLISLFLQSILILIGNRRKHSTSNMVRIVLWLAYLSADSVATVSLGILANNQEDNNSAAGDSEKPTNFVIAAFWAPFLLLHLGGPDTITAYSLEDNELWPRHLLGLVVQVVVAFYVFLRAWSSRVMNFLAIPMFIVGIIKFGERTWVLMSASSEHFRESMLPHPDPGPNYARYMEEYSSKKAEGYRVEAGVFIEAPIVGDHFSDSQDIDSTQSSALLNKAYTFFKTFKRLCADLILSFHDIVNSQSFFQNRNAEQAFQVIELELGFMYDVFYTKALLVYSFIGGILRCITLSFTVSVFVAFSLITEKHAYMQVDVIITYILLVGAIFLEIYALVILISSDWTNLWLSKHKNRVVDLLHTAVSSIALVKRKTWSNTLAQYNLINFCLKQRPPKCILIQKVLFIDSLLEKYRYQDLLKDVSNEYLKKLIFEQLKEKSRKASNFEACKQLCARRGGWVLDKLECRDKLIGWAISGVEFDQSILLWHIATDLCYYSDVNRNYVPSRNCEASKQLSNYMLYLLVMRPFMLPNGIGEIRFRDTCAEAEEFFTERKSISDAKKACTLLLKVSTDILPSKVKGDRSKSVLFDACRLAKALQSQEAKVNWDKWMLMSQVWVEMLSYAANQCRWSGHAQQLRRGGELLTHVWLLMAHLGLTEQFQISEGHVRAKLIVQ